MTRKEDEIGRIPSRGTDGFERSLLSAGRLDDSAPNVEEGWRRFAGQMAFVAGGIEPISGVHTLSNDAPSGAASPPVVSLPPEPPVSAPGLIDGATNSGQTGGTVAATALSVKPILLGLLGGVLLGGGLWFGNREAPSESHRVVEMAETSPAPTPSPLELEDEPAEPESATAKAAPKNIVVNQSSHTSTTKKVPKRSPVTVPRSSRSKAKASKPFNENHVDSGSTLTGQVLLLDEARQAPASRAVHLVDEFHRRFPKAALRADAEIIALGALRTLGHTTDFRLRSNHFLKNYPRDPHSKRVRHWLEKLR